MKRKQKNRKRTVSEAQQTNLLLKLLIKKTDLVAQMLITAAFLSTNPEQVDDARHELHELDKQYNRPEMYLE